ncbi:MAG: SDR family oxidoreductase [Bdellovibrionaceae bacterium]|nr:SDR family oxidoreductase [Pseudobdellovibrionaceae bacterium]
MVFGSHKGLGAAIVKGLLEDPHQDSLALSVVGVSRKDEGLWNEDPRYTFLSYDFADEGFYEGLLTQIQIFAPDHIIYCAGGGPFGPYGGQKWNAHQWTYKVNFMWPAQLCWYLAHNFTKTKFTFIGSSIAEAQVGDPAGASYAASKWAMRGLISSLQEHYPQRFYLYSPGYMDTDMLPPKSYPRVNGDRILNPAEVAEDLVQWLTDSSKNDFHKTV